MKSNGIQFTLEKSKIKLILKELDELKTEKELKVYLETLDLSELIEIYIIQSFEISRIKKVILASFKEND